MLVAGAPGMERQLLAVSLAEELRRLGHRVGRAEARPGALVVELASGGRVTAAAPQEPGAALPALARLARGLDPQLELLLLEEDGPPGERTLPTVELVPPQGSPATPAAALLAAVADPGSAPRLAALVERRVLGRAAGRSLDAADGRRRRGAGRRLAGTLSRLRRVLGLRARRG